MDKARINNIWPRVGGLLAIIISFYAIIRWDIESEISILFLLNLAVLMFHEFEEYVFPGGFKKFFNYHTVFALPEPQENAPVNDTLILFINLGLWPVYFLAYLFAESIPWLGVGMIIFNITNIFGHIILFQFRKKGYNPGLLTAFFLMLPITIYVLNFVNTNHILNTIEYTIAIVLGLLAAISLPITGIKARKYYLQQLNL